MKLILLLRHGKSDWDAEYDEDVDRPLAARGKKAARFMGDLLSRSGIEPDRIVSSPAVRAERTAHLAVGAAGWKAAVDLEASLYEGSVDSVVSLLRSSDEAAGTILLVGHEPTWSTTTSRLVGGGAHRVPTAAAVGIEALVDDWSDLDTGRGILRFLLIPRLLMRASEGLD